MTARPRTRPETGAEHALRMGVRCVRLQEGALPGDPPTVVLHLYGGRVALLFQDAEGNPGGALHVLGADGRLVGVIS